MLGKVISIDEYKLEKYTKEHETTTEASGNTIIGQTLIQKQAVQPEIIGFGTFRMIETPAQEQAVQPTPPESLYTRDHYFVKIIEILNQCLRQLELALKEYEDEIAREDTMLLFAHYLHKVSHLAMLFEVNQNFEDIITAIQAGIKNKKGEPYTCEEIATLRNVVKTLRQGPIISDQTYGRCLDALDEKFKLGLPEEFELEI